MHLQVGLALARNAEGSSAALGILSGMGLTPSSRGWVEEMGQLLAPEALRRAAYLANAFLLVLPAPVRCLIESSLFVRCLTCVDAWTTVQRTAEWLIHVHGICTESLARTPPKNLQKHTPTHEQSVGN